MSKHKKSKKHQKEHQTTEQSVHQKERKSQLPHQKSKVAKPHPVSVEKQKNEKLHLLKEKASQIPEMLYIGIKNQFASFLLMLIALFVLSFIGVIFYGKLMTPINIAKLLPVEETVALAEFHARRTLGDTDDLKQFVDSNVLPSQDWMNIVQSNFGLDFRLDILPWLGYHHGIALLELDAVGHVTSHQYVLFLQSMDSSATTETLKKLTLKSQKDTIVEDIYEGYSYYYFSVGQNVYFMHLDDYFVFAPSFEALRMLIDTRVKKSLTVSENPSYVQVRNNVNKGNIFVYFDPLTFATYALTKSPSSLNTFYLPLIGLFDGGGISMFFENSAVVAQSYFHLGREPGESLRVHRSKSYNADLIDMMPGDYEYVWGSRDVSGMLADVGGLLNHLHPSGYNILEGILNAYKEKYFGNSVDLKNDLYAVFEEEFVLGLYARPERVDYLFIAEIEERDTVEKLIKSYTETMTSKGYTLQKDAPQNDAPVGEPAVEAVPVVESKEEIENKELGIQVLPFDGVSNFYVTLSDTMVMVSSDRQRLLNVINGENPIQATPLTISDYLKSYDEVNIISPVFMAELLPEQYGKYLRGLQRIQGAKSIFMDGVSVVHVFEF